MAEGGKGAVTPTSILARKLVEGYLTLRGRFRHLSEPTRQDEAIRHIQDRVDAYWKQVNG
ncbi:MAG: hypothetical protein ABI955_04290 [Nitrospirota bacterium]